jgi:hypothetical protein
VKAGSHVTTRPSKQLLSPRSALLVGYSGFLLAAALPLVLWHRVIAAVASDFRLELAYLVTGWTAWGLIALGLLFFVPVVVSIGRRPQSRLYPRSRNAYAGWGVSLYTLGLALASQVAAVAGVASS